MTRPCGCGGNAALKCNCVIVPGPRTAVTGIGTPETPYEVTADTGYLTVTDTPSVDLTLTGDGSSATPHNLSVELRRDPDNANMLTIGPDGVLVSCWDIQDCLVGFMAGDGLIWLDSRLIVDLSWDEGNILTFDDFGSLYAAIPVQPRGRIGKTAAQVIPSSMSTSTVIAVDQPMTDNAGLHTAVGRLTAPIAGGYQVGATIQWQNLGTNANTGHRAVFLRLNGSQLIAADQTDAAASFSTIQNVSTSIELMAGDYVEVVVQQSQGQSINVLAVNGFTPTLWMYHVTEEV